SHSQRRQAVMEKRAAMAGSRRSGPDARNRRRKRWSQEGTRTSNALDLEAKGFTFRSANAVAESLKQSALRSRRRKGTAYQSAMSMLNFYINRAGRGMTRSRRAVLERAKVALRKAFRRERPTHSARSRS